MTVGDKAQARRRTPKPVPTLEAVLVDTLSRSMSQMAVDIGEIRTSQGASNEALHTMKNAMQPMMSLPERLKKLEDASAEAAAQKKGYLLILEIIGKMTPVIWAFVVAGLAYVFRKDISG